MIMRFFAEYFLVLILRRLMRKLGMEDGQMVQSLTFLNFVSERAVDCLVFFLGAAN